MFRSRSASSSLRGGLQIFRSLSQAKDATVAHASELSGRLRVGPMKRLYKYYTPGAINLAGGLPMDSTFPFHAIDVHLSPASKPVVSSDATSPSTVDESFTLKRGENLWLNYHRGDGLPVIKDWVASHVDEMHPPAYEGRGSCVTVGSTDAWTKSLLLIDTDIVLFDEFAYGAAVNAASAFGKSPVGVSTDAEGMMPESLRANVLAARAAGKKANIVYTVPVGHNPTGATVTLQRKKELYAVCQELDLILVEDDAYYYLYFDGQELPGCRELPTSFLSLDTDGRVLRFDSLSKFLAPATRLGWVTGPASFIDKYLLLQECTAQFPSGLSQSIVNGLLSHWGADRFHIHLQGIQAHYKSQCDALMNALKKHISSDVVTYENPKGGMFVWLTFKGLKGVTSFDLFRELAAAGVICVPGEDFQIASLVEEENAVRAKQPPAIRLTFAAASPAQMEDGIAKMAVVIDRLVANQ